MENYYHLLYVDSVTRVMRLTLAIVYIRKRCK